MLRLFPGHRGVTFGWLAASIAAIAIAATPAALSAQSTRLNGDVNNDNIVDQVDAQAVLRGIIDIPLAAGLDLTYGDANCDGRVTAIDAQIILMKAASIDVSSLCVGRQVGAPVAAITVTPATGSVVAGGFPLQLNATPLDPANNALTFKTIIWTSSDVTMATVSNNGLVQGVAAGAVNISATNGSVTTIVPITVVSSTSITMTVSPSAALADVGRTVPLSLELRDAANNILPDRAVVWKSSNPKIAAVNASTGLVTGVAPGTVTITADAGNGVTSTSSVTIVSTGAVTRTWKGTTSTDWNTASNWVENAVPVPTDTVQIPAGTPNVATLSSRTVIAGIKVLKDATLAMGSNELQITGRLEVDGQITGTGKLVTQGLNQSTTYVRGSLPTLTVTGQTELTDDVTIAGSLEINPVSTLQMHGRKLTVAQNLTVRGGLIMRERTAVLDVRGNARFFNDGGNTNAGLRTVWTTGTFKLGGNLTVYTPVKSAISPLEASGTNRIILNGSGPQIVADTGVTSVPLNELDISSGAVEFRSHSWNNEPDSTRFLFGGRVIGTIASNISGNARVVAMKDITTAGGTLSVRNLSVRGLIVASGTFSPDTLTMLGAVPTTPAPQLIPAGAPYQYNNLVIAGVDKFAGSTTIAGGLTLGCLTPLANCTAFDTPSLTIGGNSITVNGDVRQSPLQSASPFAVQYTTPLIMDNDADNVTIKGGLLGPVGTTVGTTPVPASLPVEFTVSGSEWTKGTLRVAGNVAVIGSGAPLGTHTFVMNGAASQSLRARTGFNFNTFNIANTSTGGVVSDDTTQVVRSVFRQRTANVRRNLTISTATKLTGTGKFTVQGDVQTAPGSTLDLMWISIGSVQRVSGTWAPDTTEYSSTTVAQTIQNIAGYKHVRVSGKAAFGGNIGIANGLDVLQDGELDMERRSVTVVGTANITGILRMQDARDTLTVDGNANFNRVTGDLPTQTLVTAGVLKVTGNITGAKSGGFYPTGAHKTIWTGGFGTTARGDYNSFEAATKVLSTGALPLIDSVSVRGTFTSAASVTKLSIDTLTVSLDADLTQADTVFTQTGNSRLTFLGSLKIRKMKVTGVNRVTVAKDLEIVDAGMLDGQIIYSGAYTEAGTVTDLDKNKAVLATLNSIVWVVQPTTTPVNTPITPAPTAELRDAANKLIVGTQYAYLNASTGNVNGAASIRVKFVNGVVTLANVSLDTPGATQTLQLKVQLPGGGQHTSNSNVFTVTP